MGGLAHGCVVHVQITADRPDHDLARVEPDPDMDEGSLAAANLLRVPLDRLLHAESGIAGPHGVVLVGDRCSEEGHDAVTHHLVDGTLVAVNGLHHVLQHRVEQLARLLGVTVGQQLHRALEIGKQHGDLLPLALQGGLGGQDLLGEVPGRIELGRGEARLRPGDDAHRMGALEAKLRGWR